MRRWFSILSLLVAVVPLCCVASPPRPKTSHYFHSEGGGFGGDAEKHEMFYGITLSVRAPIPEGAVADFLFENPADSKHPLLTSVTIKTGSKTVSAKSPALPDIKNHWLYLIRVILYSDETRKQELGEHLQKLEFSVSDQLFETVFKKQYFKQG